MIIVKNNTDYEMQRSFITQTQTSSWYKTIVPAFLYNMAVYTVCWSWSKSGQKKLLL